MSDPVAILEGDFVVAAWLLEAVCRCGRCPGAFGRTLVLVRRGPEHYMLDVRPGGSDVLGFDGLFDSDDEAIALVQLQVEAALEKLGEGARSRSLQILTADVGQLRAKLDDFMGVFTQEDVLRLSGRQAGGEP